VQAQELRRRKNPCGCSGGVKRSKHEGSEVPGVPAGKSRYGVPRARTVNRHRWMGRGSQGRRKKHCQGTRQNGPVTSGEGAPGVRTGPQRTGPGNCLAKTQVYAKPQGEVYGLTPARCWKVKWRCKHTSGEIEIQVKMLVTRARTERPHGALLQPGAGVRCCMYRIGGRL